jgi:hypothetical protein
MSNSEEEPQREWRHPTLTLVMFFTGVILLLPGICSLLLVKDIWSVGSGQLGWIVCFAIGGLWLIWKSFRPR